MLPDGKNKTSLILKRIYRSVNTHTKRLSRVPFRLGPSQLTSVTHTCGAGAVNRAPRPPIISSFCLIIELETTGKCKLLPSTPESLEADGSFVDGRAREPNNGRKWNGQRNSALKFDLKLLESPCSGSFDYLSLT